MAYRLPKVSVSDSKGFVFRELTLYGTCRHTFDKVALEAEEQYEDREDGEEGTHNQQVIVVTVRGKQRLQTDGKREFLTVAQYHERP